MKEEYTCSIHIPSQSKRLQNSLIISFCNAIEEYNPQIDKWRKVGSIDIK